MTTGPPIPEERCRIHPAGGLGVPPKSLSAPQEWGDRGVEKTMFRRIRHAGAVMSTMKYANGLICVTLNPSPWLRTGYAKGLSLPQGEILRSAQNDILWSDV